MSSIARHLKFSQSFIRHCWCFAPTVNIYLLVKNTNKSKSFLQNNTSVSSSQFVKLEQICIENYLSIYDFKMLILVTERSRSAVVNF